MADIREWLGVQAPACEIYECPCDYIVEVIRGKGEVGLSLSHPK